jgi:xanthine dehydrogenase/oxidase
MLIYFLPKANRWRKRGISLVPLRYGINWADSRYTAYVAIFRKDGTISITHGGVEMGQGINTKVYKQSQSSP